MQQLRTEFTVGNLHGDALLRSVSRDYSVFEILLENGQHFTLQGKRARDGAFIWGAEPYTDCDELAGRIGRQLERAMA